MGEVDLTAQTCMLQAAANHAQNSLLAALLLLVWSRIKPGGLLLLIAQLGSTLSVIFATLILVSARGRSSWEVRVDMGAPWQT